MNSIIRFLYRYSPFLNIFVTFSAIAYCFSVVDFSGITGAALSWYGRFSDTALVFNGGAVISGILNLLFAHRVYGAVKLKNYKSSLLIAVILVAASLGSFGIAFIPVPWYHEEVVLRFTHTFAAMMTIVLWPVVGFLIAYGKLEVNGLIEKRLHILKIAIWSGLAIVAVGMFVISKLGGGFWEYEILLAIVIPFIVTAMWWWVEGVLEARTKKI